MNRGRPKSIVQRKKHLSFLVSDFEDKKIAKLAKKLNLSKTDTIIKAINLLDAQQPKLLRSQLKPKKSKTIKKVLPLINPNEDND